MTTPDEHHEDPFAAVKEAVTKTISDGHLMVLREGTNKSTSLIIVDEEGKNALEAENIKVNPFTPITIDYLKSYAVPEGFNYVVPSIDLANGVGGYGDSHVLLAGAKCISKTAEALAAEKAMMEVARNRI